MAIPISVVWETRASGAGVSDSNGGGWAPVTVSTFTGTDLVVDASVNTKVTSVTHNFVTADVGAQLQISAGTGWTTGFYTIVSVAANAATLNASPAATSTTGGTWTMVGQDRSQQGSPQVVINNSSITTSIAANVITFTGATYTPTVADVGNAVKMLTGTNVTLGWYVITGFTSTTWTVAGTAALPTSGTTTNATGNMGGALLTLAGLAGAMVASNRAFVTGAFSSAATTTFAQTAPTGTAASPATRLTGYGATRGDGVHATLTLTTNTGLTGLSITNGVFIIENVDVDCGSLGTSTGMNFGGVSSYAMRCKVANFATAGIVMTSGSGIIQCEATGGIAGATGGLKTSTTGIVLRSFSHDNACSGIVVNSVSQVLESISCNNSGASSDGIQAADRCCMNNNTCHNNGRHGLSDLGSANILNNWVDNVLTSNGASGTGFGIAGNTSAVAASFEFDGNAFFSNASGTRSNIDSVTGQFGVNPYVSTRDVILTASPYVGPTTGTTANFALNNAAGGGAACRGKGLPTTWPGNTGTTSHPDMGAVQTAAGGSPGIITAS